VAEHGGERYKISGVVSVWNVRRVGKDDSFGWNLALDLASAAALSIEGNILCTVSEWCSSTGNIAHMAGCGGSTGFGRGKESMIIREEPGC
jgi:hypothetical protein